MTRPGMNLLLSASTAGGNGRRGCGIQLWAQRQEYSPHLKTVPCHSGEGVRAHCIAVLCAIDYGSWSG